MKQGRTPDRVHVVRPPQTDEYERTHMPMAAQPPAPRDGKAMEIIRTLAQISDKLKRSEAERYELLAELREYRKTLNDLEDKAEKSEKAFLALENKFKSRDAIEQEVSQRQARFERALKDAESKLVQAAAGTALMDQRIKDIDDFKVMVTQRIDTTAAEQTRLDRQIEKIVQDKSRMLRKVERMEEILTETQDTLKARALVLLTDQSTAAQALPHLTALPAPGDEGLESTESSSAPWWRKSVRMQSVGMAAIVVAALLSGWTINQIQQPQIPQIAVLENGGLAKLNLSENRWEPLNAAPSQNTPSQDRAPPQAKPETAPMADVPEKGQQSSASQNNTALDIPPVTTDELGLAAQTASLETPNRVADVMTASDEELMAALESDPDGLAAQMNALEPSVGKALDLPVSQSQNAGFDPLSSLRTKALAQDPQLSNTIAKEKGTGLLGTRINRDEDLPPTIQELENQAFAGVPEAQHDLAALYTAGRGGVTQNFERAALWFREAADQGVGNAAYNLGVLYHQGLGVEKDLPRALYWYREAAKQNHPEAQYNLGIANIEGIGTSYNAPIAAAFFENAANLGVIEAAYNLGLIYENRLLGDQVNPEQALMWYHIAANGGNSDASAALTQMAAGLNLSQSDVKNMIDRMLSNYESTHGRKAGLNQAAAQTKASSTTLTPTGQTAVIVEVQKLLRETGYYDGPADGMLGPQTTQAIRTYQLENNLTADGMPSPSLIDHIQQML